MRGWGARLATIPAPIFGKPSSKNRLEASPVQPDAAALKTEPNSWEWKVTSPGYRRIRALILIPQSDARREKKTRRAVEVEITGNR
jgi:hypothetical protein